jgi:hypothetical protein
METITKTRTHQILMVMRVLAWIGFIGLAIKAGAMLISYGVSWVNPAAAKDFYQGMNMDVLRQFSFKYYSMVMSLMIGLVMMKATVLSLVIKAVSKVNLTNPFTLEMVSVLERMSHLLIGSWVVAIIHNGYINWLSHRTEISLADWPTDESFFMAGIVFVISQVFKRGVEIQSENELTI